VAHKYILGLQDKVRRNVKVSSQAGAAATGRQLVGGITLHVRNDGAICTAIASEGYDPDQGARSLQAAVQSRIGDELVQSYLEEEGLIQDGQPLIEYTVEMARNGVLSVLKKSW
jgi:ATP-dependent Clp protease ATP-binding subunit ClpA